MDHGSLVAPAPTEGHGAWSCDHHVDGFRQRLADLGYPPRTIKARLRVVSALVRWMREERVPLGGLEEGRAAAFVATRRRLGRHCDGYEHTICQFIEWLGSAGAAPAPTRDDSPATVLLARYEDHLRRERGLAEGTVTSYRRFVRPFVLERLGDGLAGAGRIDAQVVRDFLLAGVRRRAPRYAQFVAKSLRSFLRFLFRHGATAADLSLAVPTVRRWRFSDVPRYVSAEDVERLLGACDRSTATGRRDHAILLLLARLGLRAGEVVALELDDLRWRDGEIVVRGKGLVHDRIPLLPDVGAALALYLRKDRPDARSRRVFLRATAPRRGFYGAGAVSLIVKRAFARAGLHPRCRGAHTLRHSLATALVRRGASMAEIGEVLRHRSPDTTAIYAKLDFDALREVALPWPATGGER